MDDGVIESTPKNYALLHKEIDRLVEITGSIMEYEKLEQTDRDMLKIVPVNCTKTIKSLREEYAPLLAKHQQHIVLEEDTHSVILPFDESKFIQLLHNIFSNFVKYAGEGKTLRVKSTEKDGQVSWIFQDNGNGVAKKELAFIREKFYQADKSRSASSDRGIGIGLSIIEKIISLHG